MNSFYERVTKPGHSINSNNNSLGTTLILNSIFGIFGVDRLYVGQNILALLILISTILILPIPYIFAFSYASCWSLIYSIFTKESKSYMYPNIIFNEANNFDRFIGYVFLSFHLIIILVILFLIIIVQ